LNTLGARKKKKEKPDYILGQCCIHDTATKRQVRWGGLECGKDSKRESQKRDAIRSRGGQKGKKVTNLVLQGKKKGVEKRFKSTLTQKKALCNTKRQE